MNGDLLRLFSSHFIQAPRDSLTPAEFSPSHLHWTCHFMLQISADVCVATITLWVSPGQRRFLKISLHPLHSIECLAHRRYLRDVWEQTDGTYMMNLSWHSCLLPTGPLSAIYSPHCLSYPHHSGWRCLFAPVQIRNDAKRRLVSTMSLNPHDSEVSRCRCPGNRESHNVYSLLGSEVPSTVSPCLLQPVACSVSSTEFEASHIWGLCPNPTSSASTTKSHICSINVCRINTWMDDRWSNLHLLKGDRELHSQNLLTPPTTSQRVPVCALS